MEGGGVVSTEKQNTDSTTTSSYTYWVREVKQDAAPLPVPRKLTAEDVSAGSGSCTHLGSAWNKCSGSMLFITYLITCLRLDGNYSCLVMMVVCVFTRKYILVEVD
ncbi:putative activator of 90kDa heat shock protein ATPase [Helianthus annuus]|nr:putative activator of 90kDa heat shock protein ATPase [Helianthus annuus]